MMTSGAIQNGVPTNVSLFLLVSVSWPATPKSASFTSPVSDRSTLAATNNQDRGNLISCKLMGSAQSLRHVHGINIQKARDPYGLVLSQFFQVVVRK